MKKYYILPVFSFAFSFLFSVSAFALPKCSVEKTNAAYIASWSKNAGEWELSFTCKNNVKAKIGIEGEIDVKDDSGIFFVMKEDGSREGEDYYNDACEAVAEYCDTTIDADITPPAEIVDGAESETGISVTEDTEVPADPEQNANIAEEEGY